MLGGLLERQGRRRSATDPSRRRQGQARKLRLAQGPPLEFLTPRTSPGSPSSERQVKIELNETDDELHITAKGKLVIEARELEIKVDSRAKIEAGGEMKIKGATVALN